MAWPTEPTQPLPTWANGGDALKSDPGTDKRALGWGFDPLNPSYGEQPPFQWQNNEMFNNGQWATYFRSFINYTKTNPSPFLPSVLMLSQTPRASYAMDGSQRSVNFNNQDSFNYSGLAGWDFTNRQVLAPFDGLCEISLMNDTNSFNTSGASAGFTIYKNNILTAAFSYNSHIYTIDFTDFYIIDAVSITTKFLVSAGDVITFAIAASSLTPGLNYFFGNSVTTNNITPQAMISFYRGT